MRRIPGRRQRFLGWEVKTEMLAARWNEQEGELRAPPNSRPPAVEGSLDSLPPQPPLATSHGGLGASHPLAEALFEPRLNRMPVAALTLGMLNPLRYGSATRASEMRCRNLLFMCAHHRVRSLHAHPT